MAKVLSNLLSNAFKFTPEGGAITVSIDLPAAKCPSGKGVKGVGQNDHRRGVLEISIRDTGIGISEEELLKIFDRFYQVDTSQTREHEGTGIGLALAKELVELHHGSIRVSSQKASPNTGRAGWTEFIIEFPLGRAHLRDDEIAETQFDMKDAAPVAQQDLEQIDYQKLGQKELPQADGSDITARAELVETGEEDKSLILVVEDNPDVREYIKDSLSDNFNIEEATDGLQGVEKAEALIPDLIISDIMMPRMDGNELSIPAKRYTLPAGPRFSRKTNLGLEFSIIADCANSI